MDNRHTKGQKENRQKKSSEGWKITYRKKKLNGLIQAAVTRLSSRWRLSITVLCAPLGRVCVWGGLSCTYDLFMNLFL